MASTVETQGLFVTAIPLSIFNEPVAQVKLIS